MFKKLDWFFFGEESADSTMTTFYAAVSIVSIIAFYAGYSEGVKAEHKRAQQVLDMVNLMLETEGFKLTEVKVF